jgi:hypothetical protein
VAAGLCPGAQRQLGLAAIVARAASEVLAPGSTQGDVPGIPRAWVYCLVLLADPTLARLTILVGAARACSRRRAALLDQGVWRARSNRIADHDRELTALWRLRRKDCASWRLRVETMIWRETYPAVGAEFGTRSGEAAAARTGARYRTTTLSAELGAGRYTCPTVRTRHVWRPRLSTPHKLAGWLTYAPASALVGLDAVKAVEPA